MPNSVQEALQAFAAGELVVVTDDEDREGEGDLIVAASVYRGEDGVRQHLTIADMIAYRQARALLIERVATSVTERDRLQRTP